MLSVREAIERRGHGIVYVLDCITYDVGRGIYCVSSSIFYIVGYLFRSFQADSRLHISN